VLVSCENNPVLNRGFMTFDKVGKIGTERDLFRECFMIPKLSTDDDKSQYLFGLMKVLASADFRFKFSREGSFGDKI
jgi:hypothetical protein